MPTEKTSTQGRVLNTRSAPAVSAGHSIHPLYRIIKEICSDPLGVLYSAEYIPEKRKVAVKVLRRGVSCNLAPPLLKVEDTLRIIDTVKGVHGETMIVAEHPVGEALKKTMSRQGLLFARPAVMIAAQILSVVKKLHQEGRFVGALHPGTVFVSRTPDNKLRVKLAYFNPSACTSFVNAERYSAPESIDQGGIGDQSSDLWAVGAVLYEMLFGLVPFQSTAGNERNSSKNPSEDRSGTEELFLSSGFISDSPALAAVLRKALNRNPALRYPSAAAMQKALLDVVSNSSTVSVSHAPASTAESAASELGRESIPTIPSPPRNSLIVESSKLGAGFMSEMDEDDTRPIIPPEELAEMLSKKGRLGGVFSSNPKKMSIALVAAAAIVLVGAFFLFRISGALQGPTNPQQRSEQTVKPPDALDAARPVVEKPKELSNPDKTEETRSADIKTSEAAGEPSEESHRSTKSSSLKGKKKSGKTGKGGPVDNLSSNPFFLKNNPFPGGE